MHGVSSSMAMVINMTSVGLFYAYNKHTHTGIQPALRPTHDVMNYDSK